MEAEKRLNVFLSIMAILDIVAGIGGTLWLCTVGLVIVIYSSQINHTLTPFLALVVWVPFGIFYAIAAIALFKRREWSRRFFILFWLVVLLFATGSVLLNLKDIIGNEYWMDSVLPAFWMSFIAILHIAFLANGKIKALFKKQ